MKIYALLSQVLLKLLRLEKFTWKHLFQFSDQNARAFFTSILKIKQKRPAITYVHAGLFYFNGGASHCLSQPSFLAIDLCEIVAINKPKAYENATFLTDLYLKKQWSLRQISDEIGCSKNTVRKKLKEAGVTLSENSASKYKALRKKIRELRTRGLSYQSIADLFNLWKIETRSAEGKWHAKTIRDIDQE